MHRPRPARLLPLLLLLTVVACTRADARPLDPQPDSAAFVTRLGADTLVVERFVTHPERVEAEVMIRTPQTELRRYTLERDPDGSLTRMEAWTYAGDALDADPVGHDVLEFRADSLVLVATREGETTETRMEGHRGVIPFLDMIHWPFDVVLRQMAGNDVDSMTVDMFVGRRTAPFVVRRFFEGGASITHPTRGTMDATTDEYGRLLTLDAGATTRKLTVERKSWIDIDGVVARYAGMDAEGRSFGPLSGRGKAEAQVGDATVTLDFGTPVKRGREIWGALVAYGEVWRTGANRATHLTTDRDLVVGGLDVPAGTYTLYSIPGADESVLMINRMTDQGGTTYDASQDLGRVALEHREVATPVEVFNIEVRDAGGSHELVLAWDRRELFVPISAE